MKPVDANLDSLLSPIVEGLKYEYVGALFGQAESGQTLRVYIDTPDAGVEVDDCAQVSRQLSAMLDVEEPIAGAYCLEVSSPGLDRPLFKLSHFTAQIGCEIRLRTRIAVEGRKNFRGKLVSVDDSNLEISVDGQVHHVLFAQVEKANLVPQYD